MRRSLSFALLCALTLALLAACQPAGLATPTGEPPLPTRTPTAESSPMPPTIEPAQAATPAPAERVQVYLIAVGDGGESGLLVGCGDSAVPVEIEVEPSGVPLQAALDALLALDDEEIGETGLYNALHQSDLTVDAVTVARDGTAIIAVSGTLLLGGTCDTPRAIAQLEQTALQFPDVTAVDVRINGDPISLVLEEQGLPGEAGIPPATAPQRAANRALLYMIALGDAGRTGELVGCDDSLVPIETTIDPAGDPLEQVMQALVATRTRTVSPSGLYNSLHTSQLTVQRVEHYRDGAATVYLGGYVEFGGACDLPRFEAQLMQTALQFPDVTEVEILINDQPLNIITGSAGRDEGGIDRAFIFLIGMGDAGRSGEEIGCGDSVVPVEVSLQPATTAPLSAVLRELLAIPDDFYRNTGLYNALDQSSLSLDSASIRSDGTAVVRLSGQLLLGGTCDVPRVKAQLEKTILQFPTVSRAEITINGVPLDTALSQQ